MNEIKRRVKLFFLKKSVKLVQTKMKKVADKNKKIVLIFSANIKMQKTKKKGILTFIM